MGTSTWPPAGTSTRPPTGTLSWPGTAVRVGSVGRLRQQEVSSRDNRRRHRAVLDGTTPPDGCTSRHQRRSRMRPKKVCKTELGVSSPRRRCHQRSPGRHDPASSASRRRWPEAGPAPAPRRSKIAEPDRRRRRQGAGEPGMTTLREASYHHEVLGSAYRAGPPCSEHDASIAHRTRLARRSLNLGSPAAYATMASRPRSATSVTGVNESAGSRDA